MKYQSPAVASVAAELAEAGLLVHRAREARILAYRRGKEIDPGCDRSQPGNKVLGRDGKEYPAHQPPRADKPLSQWDSRENQ